MMEMLRVNTNGFTTNVLGLPREPSLQGSGFVQVSDCLFFPLCCWCICSMVCKAFDCSDVSFTLFVSCFADCKKKRTKK